MKKRSIDKINNHQLSSNFYSSETIFKSTINNIFVQAWHILGPYQKFNNNVSYPLTILDGTASIPIIVYRGKELNQPTILSNVCTHRGHLVLNDCSQRKSLRCRYHGRKFTLSGKFVNAPGFTENKQFPSKNDCLPKLRSHVFSNLLFSNINYKVGYDLFDVINSICGWYPFDTLIYNNTLSKSYDIRSHWSLYVENYLEGLHVPFIHSGLSSALDLNLYKTQEHGSAIVQYGFASRQEEALSKIEGSPDEAKTYYGIYIYLFPNIMINIYNWGVSYNYIIPVAPNRTIVRYFVFSFNENINIDGCDSISTVELEDQDVVINVQRGVQSPLYKPGILSSKHEQGVIAFRKKLIESLKKII